MKGTFTQRIPNWYECANPDKFEYSSTEELLSRQSVNWCERLKDFVRYGIRRGEDFVQLVAVRSEGMWILGYLTGDIPEDIEPYKSEFDLSLETLRNQKAPV